VVRVAPRDHSWNAPLGEPGNVVLEVVGVTAVVLLVDDAGTLVLVDGETPHDVRHDSAVSRQA
jgi:hypothetical protein